MVQEKTIFQAKIKEPELFLMFGETGTLHFLTWMYQLKIDINIFYYQTKKIETKVSADGTTTAATEDERIDYDCNADVNKCYFISPDKSEDDWKICFCGHMGGIQSPSEMMSRYLDEHKNGTNLLGSGRTFLVFGDGEHFTLAYIHPKGGNAIVKEAQTKKTALIEAEESKKNPILPDIDEDNNHLRLASRIFTEMKVSTLTSDISPDKQSMNDLYEMQEKRRTELKNLQPFKPHGIDASVKWIPAQPNLKKRGTGESLTSNLLTRMMEHVKLSEERNLYVACKRRRLSLDEGNQLKIAFHRTVEYERKLWAWEFYMKHVTELEKKECAVFLKLTKSWAAKRAASYLKSTTKGSHKAYLKKVNNPKTKGKEVETNLEHWKQLLDSKFPRKDGIDPEKKDPYYSKYVGEIDANPDEETSEEEEEEAEDSTSKKKVKGESLVATVKEISHLQYNDKNSFGDDCKHFRCKTYRQNGKIQMRRQYINPDWVDHVFDPVFVALVTQTKGAWWPVPVGSATTEVAPSLILSRQSIRFPQGNRNLCVPFSLANALAYLSEDKDLGIQLRQNFEEASREISNFKWTPGLPVESYIADIRHLMQKYCKPIGNCQIFNKQLRRGKKRTIAANEILQKHDPFPMLVVLIGNDGSSNHAVTILDDLIFDSTQPYAIKKSRKSLDWLCGDDGFTKLGVAYLFNQKFASKRPQIERTVKINYA